MGKEIHIHERSALLVFRYQLKKPEVTSDRAGLDSGKVYNNILVGKPSDIECAFGLGIDYPLVSVESMIPKVCRLTAQLNRSAPSSRHHWLSYVPHALMKLKFRSTYHS